MEGALKSTVMLLPQCVPTQVVHRNFERGEVCGMLTCLWIGCASLQCLEVVGKTTVEEEDKEQLVLAVRL